MWTPQDAAKHQKTKDSSTPLATKATATPTPHYKLNMRPTAKFHPISLSSPSRHHDKQRLFEGLEDSIGGGGGGGGSETFVPRRSIKKLNIKPKPTQVRGSAVPRLLPPAFNFCTELVLSPGLIRRVYHLHHARVGFGSGTETSTEWDKS